MRRRAGFLALALIVPALGVTGQATAAAGAPAPPPPAPTAQATKAAGQRAVAAVAARPGAVRGGAGQSFQVKGVIVDRNGATHTRLTRTYNRLPVLGGDVVVHTDAAGAWKGSSLTLTKAPGDSKPGLSATKVQKKAPSKGYKVRGAAELVVEARTKASAPRLAWRFKTEGRQKDGTPSRVYVSVDAETGKVLLREESVHTAAGDGQSLYGGTVPLQTTQSGSTFQLKDPTRGNTYTGDAQNQSDFCIFIWCIWRAPSNVVTDADNHWGNGTASDRATVAVDAQYGTNMTWDYYKNTFGRNGIKGDGAGSFNRVHYGSNYANAFWDDSCFCMTYGDGDGTNVGPLVSLDVAAHEMTHGVTSTTANLTYSAESGGLNEATSDIFAAAVEFYAANGSDKADYLVGEKIVRAGFGKEALRFMDRPSRDGNSADSWSSGVGNMDVHFSSGVGNHFFYLLAEGSGAKTINGVSYNSPTSNGSTVTGIGVDAAARIWFKALTAYMTSNTNYAGARTATLNAARDLYGVSSTQYAAVAAAWSAVNVN